MITDVSPVATVTLNGSGNGQVSVGPPTGTRWALRLATGSVSTATNAPSFALYRGSSSGPLELIDSMPTLASQASSAKVGGAVFYAGQVLWGVWSGGDAGATATLQAFGRQGLKNDPLGEEPVGEGFPLVTTSLTLPTGATTGTRIVLNGKTGNITLFDNAGNAIRVIGSNVTGIGNEVDAIRSDGDTSDRLVLTKDGTVWFGLGTGSLPDAFISHDSAASTLDLSLNVLVEKTLTVGGSGFAGQVVIIPSGTAGVALIVELSGDANPRVAVLGDGKHQWSNGTAVADVNLYRHAAGVLRTDTALAAGQVLINKTSAVALMSTTTTNATDQAWSNKVGVETGNRLVVLGNGEHDWSDGTLAADATLSRTAAATLGVGLADLAVTTPGKGLKVAEGGNAKMGTAALVAGSAVVNNTTVTANSRIFLCCETPGGAPGFLRVSARTAGTSFTVTSSSGTDTSTIAWLMLEPA